MHSADHGVHRRCRLEVALSSHPGATATFGPVMSNLGFKSPKGVGFRWTRAWSWWGISLCRTPIEASMRVCWSSNSPGIVTVKAIGLIATRMPDGSKGFSL